jgi:hypothetical protein
MCSVFEQTLSRLTYRAEYDFAGIRPEVVETRFDHSACHWSKPRALFEPFVSDRDNSYSLLCLRDKE